MGASQSVESVDPVVENVSVTVSNSPDTDDETVLEPYQHCDASMDWFWPVM